MNSKKIVASVISLSFPLLNIQPLFANPIIADVNNPKDTNCYIQTPNGKITDLNFCHQQITPNNTTEPQPLSNPDKSSSESKISDQLKQEIKEQIDTNLQKIEQAKNPEAQLNAIKDFADKLPYSPETRNLQNQAAKLNEQLKNVQNNEQGEKITQQLKDLQQQMMKDPVYNHVQQELLNRFVPQNNQANNQILPGKNRENIALSGNKSLGKTSKKSGVIPVINQRIAAMNWNGLRKGDIMFIKGSGINKFLYAMNWEHTGNYDGNNGVLEANPDDGVKIRSLENWKKKNQYIGLAYNNHKWNDAPRAFDNALKYQGKKYNFWFPDKETTNSFYCSQLTWRMHKDIGTDLDSNHSIYRTWIATTWGTRLSILGFSKDVKKAASALVDAAVAPDEIALSDKIKFYSQGWN